jgi:hypothetical protein
MHVFERITLVNLIGKYTKNTKNARNSFAEVGPIRSYNPGSSKVNTVKFQHAQDLKRPLCERVTYGSPSCQEYKRSGDPHVLAIMASRHRTLG